jgi:translation initiation factor 1A
MGKRKVLSEANLSDMLTPGPGQMYGTVKNLLGYDRVLVECSDGVTRVCRIRGKMKRRVWIKMNDTVLVAPWDFQTERADIMFRYTAGQVEMLRKSGQLKGL